MKVFFALATIVFLTISSSLFSQIDQYTGSWVGTVSGAGMDVRIAFHITEKDGIILTKMDSPDQNSFGNSAQKTLLKENRIMIDLPAFAIRYEGERVGDSIVGIFFQTGMEFKLNLGPLTEKLEGPKRPQNPVPPFNYKQKEVKIKTPDEKVKLAGTLTIPAGKGPFPAVILISGSGPQNRNEELLFHQPFLVLADHLTKNGIAVLRYDDRGVGQSTGNFEAANSFDFAQDAEAAWKYLAKQKKIDPKKVGIIGHSEGGLIAPIIAARNKQVGFIAMMAGPSVPGTVIIPDQTELILRMNKVEEQEIHNQLLFTKFAYDFISNNQDSKTLQEDFQREIERWLKSNPYTVPTNLSPKTFAKQTAYTLTSNWMKTFLLTQPSHFIEQVNCPILALFAENDLQVSVRANLVPMQQLLSTKKNSKIHVFPKLNHLFQTSTTGSPNEYGKIEETLAPAFLNYITEWIKKLN